jgi:hypothetical protein
MTRVPPFTGDEIAFIVKCARQGLTGKNTTLRFNAKFAAARSPGSVFHVARENGAPFGYRRGGFSAPSLANSGAPSVTVAQLRHESPFHFSFQPAMHPATRRGGQLIDFERRADEPPALGPRGEFARGCKWIHGEPQSDAWQQCGHKRAAASAYCAYHRARTIRVRTNLSSSSRGEDKRERV